MRAGRSTALWGLVQCTPPISSEEIPLCSVPAWRRGLRPLHSFLLSPQNLRFCGGPSFAKRENGPCTVEKRKRGRAGRASVFYACLRAAAWCGRGFWWLSSRLPPLFAAAALEVAELVRLPLSIGRTACRGGNLPPVFRPPAPIDRPPRRGRRPRRPIPPGRDSLQSLAKPSPPW